MTELRFNVTQDPTGWNEILLGLSRGHLLQTVEWGQVKKGNGWDAFYLTWMDKEGKIICGAMLLERSLNLRGLTFTVRMHYVPKGPIFDLDLDHALKAKVVDDVTSFSKSRKAFVLNMDPEVVLGIGFEGVEGSVEDEMGKNFVGMLRDKGWGFAESQPQFRNSIFIDLGPDEETLLANMKQKTRYNVRLAGRKGVEVRVGSEADFDMLAKMYAVTAMRDGFAIRGLDYYMNVWRIFYAQGMLKPLIAEVEGEAVAGLMLFVFGKMSWYIYGMSNGNHRNKMPTYLLQWEAIRISKEMGCDVYDLWGAPDAFDENDRMWGVYRFKQGLGGEVRRHVGNWERPLRPLIYGLYMKLVPLLMRVMRLRGKQRTQQVLED